MPDEVAKGFGISVSLDAAGAEGAEPCATHSRLKHTHGYILPTRHSALLLITHTHSHHGTHTPPYFVGSGLGMGLGFGSSRNLLAVYKYR